MTLHRKCKKTAVYKMQRDGWSDYFELHVSPTSKIMRNHIEKITKRDGWEVPNDGWNETQGLVHPMSSIDGPFAYMFLSEESLGVGVVAHECLHAAMAHERYVLRFGMNYGDGLEDLTNEERLAYFLTDTVKGVYNTLYDNNHIKPNDVRLKNDDPR